MAIDSSHRGRCSAVRTMSPTDRALAEDSAEDSADDVQADYWRSLERRYSGAGIAQALGLTLLVRGRGEVELHYDGSNAAVNLRGMISGGAISAMVDSALIQSCRTGIKPDEDVVTRELKVNFIRPAPHTRICAAGHLEYLGRSTGVASVRVMTSDGQLLAYGLGSTAVISTRGQLTSKKSGDIDSRSVDLEKDLTRSTYPPPFAKQERNMVVTVLSSRLRPNKSARWLSAVVASAASAALLLAGCSSSGSSSGSSSSKNGAVQTIDFGAMLAQTGPSATTGQQFTRGIQAEVNVINSTMGQGKFKLNPIFADNQASNTVTVSVLNQLIAVHHIAAALSTYSGPSLAAAPVATRSQVVLINHGGQSPQLAGASPYLFNAVPLVTDQMNALIDYAVKTYHYKRIALFYENNATGQGIKDGFNDAVTSAGATPAGTVSFETTDTNYRSALAKLQSMNPDAVFLGNLSQDVPGAVLSQAQSIGFGAHWMGYSAIVADSTTKVGGQGAEGLLADKPSNIDPSTKQPYTQESAFAAEYQKMFNEEPPHNADYAAEAVQILASGVKLLLDKGTSVTGPNLQKVLASSSLDTNFGSVKFTSENTVTGVPEEILRVQAGKFVVVATQRT